MERRRVGRSAAGSVGVRRAPRPNPPSPARAPGARQGLPARRLATELIACVLIDRKPLEHALAEAMARPDIASLAPRDRALARLLAATVLRRQGELEFVLNAFLERGPPDGGGALWPILLAGAAQLVALDMAPHAVVDLAVEQVRRDRKAHRFAKLTNAVLRRVAERGAELLAGQDRVRLNIPDWLWQRWSAAYGEETARRIAEASLREAPLDVSVKGDAPGWAERLGGRLLPTGSIRLEAQGRIEDLPGYADGQWWVQDAGAALVVRVAGDVAGKAVADLCAAPGGKTAGLAVAGATVTSVDVSAVRLRRLAANIARLHLSADVVEADAATWSPGHTYDAVLLDAPCTATGTIRRHPDILRLKRAEDVARMAALQRDMLANAARLVRLGGVLVYSTCSLEPEEGQRQIEAFLASEPAFERLALSAPEIGADPAWITPKGEVHSLPFHLPLEPAALSGIDGFFIARLRRSL
jgi:16S rRNA (cytosine967-C5)-methyltransferase